MRGKATLSFWFIFITCYVFGSLSYKIGSKTMQVIKITACLGILALENYGMPRYPSSCRLSARITGECRCTSRWTRLCLLFPRAQWNKDLYLGALGKCYWRLGVIWLKHVTTKNVSSASSGVSTIVSIFIANGPVEWTVEKRHMTRDDE